MAGSKMGTKIGSQKWNPIWPSLHNLFMWPETGSNFGTTVGSSFWPSRKKKSKKKNFFEHCWQVKLFFVWVGYLHSVGYG